MQDFIQKEHIISNELLCKTVNDDNWLIEVWSAEGGERNKAGVGSDSNIGRLYKRKGRGR